MAFEGRITAGAIAAGAILFTAGFGYWAGGNNGWLAAWTGGAAASMLSIPLAWFMGTKYDKLKAESIMDCLTGLYNRGFIEAAFPKLARQARRRRRKFAVLMIDVNDFKDVNDRFGHAHGDTALKLIAQAMKDSSKKGEIVARWGGDEFIAICPYSDDRQIDEWTKEYQKQLQRLAQRIGMKLSVSVGSACYPEHGSDLIHLTCSADKKMYAHKHVRQRQAKPHEALQA